MSKLQELLNEKWPIREDATLADRLTLGSFRMIFEDGYDAGAADTVFELYSLLERAFIDGGEYAQNRSKVGFKEWFGKLTS